jgi:hypothetical protein
VQGGARRLRRPPRCACRVGGGRGSPRGLHVLDKTGQLGQLLCDLRLGDESALAPPDLDEAALDQVMNRLSHGRAADFKPFDQAVFRRQLGLRAQATVSDIAGQNRLDSTSTFSRLARRSIALPPAHARGHQFVTRYPKASDISSPPCLLRLLPAGANRRVGLAPTGKRRLVTAPPLAAIAAWPEKPRGRAGGGGSRSGGLICYKRAQPAGGEGTLTRFSTLAQLMACGDPRQSG